MADYAGKVLVAGATGRTGSLVVKTLGAKGIPVRALVRNREKARAIEGPGVEIAVGNPLNPNELRKALQGITGVISAMGNTLLNSLEEMETVEHNFVSTLTAEALQTGVQHIVLCSSVGTTDPERFPYLAKVLEAKRRGEIALERSGVPYTIVRPGGLTDNPGGQGVRVRDELDTPGTISRQDLAEVLVQALLQPAARNRIVEIINDLEEEPANRPHLF